VTTSFQIKHWKNSETVWRRALDIDPQNPIARNNLGMFFLEKGAFQEAEREFRQSIARGPWQLRPHINLGDTLLQLKDFTGAEAAYRHGLSVHPRDALLRQGLGLALLELGGSQAAAKQLSIALTADQNLAYAHYGLSRVAMSRQTGEARRLAARACQLSRYRDLRLLAHYARTIALNGDIDLAYKVGLAALRQFEGMKKSDSGKEIVEVLDLCRSQRTNRPVPFIRDGSGINN